MTRPHYQEIADAIAQSERPSVSAVVITQAANVRHLKAAVIAIPKRDLAAHLVQIIRGARGQGEVDNLIQDLQREAKP
jgi:hypothetical protein